MSGAENAKTLAEEAKQFALAIFGDGDVRSDLRELNECIDKLAALASKAEALEADAGRLDYIEEWWFYKPSEATVSISFNECWETDGTDLRNAIDTYRRTAQANASRAEGGK